MAAKTFLKSTLVISLFFVVFVVSETAYAKIIYVDDNAPGNNKGFTWTNAYNDLRDAITDARSSPKPVEIRVAKGTYKPKEGVFVLINGITLKGGYAGFEESDPEDRDINLYKTILSGDCNGDDVEVIDPMDLWSEPTRADNVCVVHSTNCNETAVLDGFIITAGRSLSGGGGMYNYNSSPTIINCTFSANTAGDDGLEGGGAIYSYYGNPVLINCEFIGNSAGDSCGGGGMYNDYSNPTLINCTFIANTAEYYGGGMINFWSNPVLMDCTFTDNFSPDRGGGIHNDYGSFRPTLTDCTFIGNRSGVDGGAIYNFSGCSPKIANCTFKNNSAGKNGGAIANCFGNSPKFLNCLFTANSAGQNGGGMYNHGYSPAAATKITGCTFVTNSATNGSTVACDSYEKKHPTHLLITNCIFWDGENGIWNNDNSTITITYSNIQSGWTGQGNIDIDPCFVEPGYWEPNGVWIDGDYRLFPDSPCINAGDPNYIPEPNETDLDGNPRVIGGRTDMGAFECQPRIIYVDDDEPADFSNIQMAIDNSSHDDIIIVKPGTYTGDGNRDIDFKGKSITVRSTDPNDPNIVDSTIIDCHHLGRGFFFHSGEDGNSILSGFTIMNGQAAIGGGIYCENQSGPTIANCVIKWNTAGGQVSTGFGGGISGCNGTISNCTISNNTAEGMFNGSGGGLYDCNGTITNCTISYNTVGPSGNGGGLSECNGDIINCTILRNWTAYYLGHIGRGAGLYRCNGVIINSTISGNSITALEEAYGGGLYECNGPIINCEIKGNHVHCTYHVSAGGGLYHCDGPVINCTIWGNSTSTSLGIEAIGGGLYACDGTISNCTISYNSAEGGWEHDDGSWGIGGGLYGCNGKIINCVISDNTATVTSELENSGGAGGGLYGCSGTITNCTISRNTASDAGRYSQRQHGLGGGLCACDGTISNCTISGNIALSKYDSAGGGLCGCHGTIINCTISGNTATVTGEPAESESTGGGLSWCNGSITNCIIWANSANIGSQVYSSSEPNYCCLQDHIGGGTGNIDDDPLFTDPGYWDSTGVWIDGDYHLLPGSPCIDAGDPNYTAGPNETDLDGRPRVMGARIDMGAYEAPIFAEARILPQTINLASKGNWITCYIWFPEGYDVTDIEPNSVFLEDEIQPEQFSVDQQQQVATARFNREDVLPILGVGDVGLKITGQITDSTYFEAMDTIKVIDKAVEN